MTCTWNKFKDEREDTLKGLFKNEFYLFQIFDLKHNIHSFLKYSSNQ